MKNARWSPGSQSFKSGGKRSDWSDSYGWKRLSFMRGMLSCILPSQEVFRQAPSTFDFVDQQGEMVRAGAFAKTIRDNKQGFPLQAVHFAHGGDIESTVGLVTTARETAKGLYVRGHFLSDPDSLKYLAKVRAVMGEGLTPGLSIGYRIIKSDYETINGKNVMVLRELQLKEITLTLKPANAQAGITKLSKTVKSPAGFSVTGSITPVTPFPRRADPETPRQFVRRINTERYGEDGAAMEAAKARAKNHEATKLLELKACKAFLGATDGELKAPSAELQRARRCLRPAEECKDAHAIRLPTHIAKSLMPGRMGAKVLNTETGTGNLLVALEQMPPSVLPWAPSVYDMVSFIPTERGDVVAFPTAVQTDNNEHGGIVFQWQAHEAARKPETEGVFGSLEIATHELTGFTELSNQAISRIELLNHFLSGLFRDALRAIIEDALTRILHGPGLTHTRTAYRSPAGRLGGACRPRAGATAPL